jgi:uncharacterized membrane protein
MLLVTGSLALAQETGATQDSTSETGAATVQDATEAIQSTAESAMDRAKELGAKLNDSQTVQDISAGLLQPIYELSLYMAHPWFYWAAFALMAVGVVSFALQLVLTKFLLLFKLRMSLSEIFSDALGLLISLTGLVLVTQAATQNSTFTQSPTAVVTAAAVGVIVGFIFYLWGQKTEFQAANSRRPAPQGDQPRARM